ncbi:hypothetical protein ACIOJE_27235 [Kitasatospora sp. NPDC087861]|uniref:hypothetical protein n=1 Tax=Kitasatospora sp. NPDC087861 TaxID=3364070 RepID=UPI00380B817D
MGRLDPSNPYALEEIIQNAIRNKPKPGSYVLYRDMDRYLTGEAGHTMACRVLPPDHGEYLDQAKLLVLATKEVISYAPVAHMRHLDPAELMHDIDTAPLALLDDGPAMTAAGAWLLTQRSAAGNPRALQPATRD